MSVGDSDLKEVLYHVFYRHVSLLCLGSDPSCALAFIHLGFFQIPSDV